MRMILGIIRIKGAAMTDQDPLHFNDPPSRHPTHRGVRIITSAALLGGQREVILQHGTETYRLQLTGSNKLILTK